MKNKLSSILKGKFLIGDDAFKNWSVIVFALFLGMVMVLSAHSVDNKVYKVSSINEEVKELKSAFFDGRSRLMHLKMESYVVEKMKDKSVAPSLEPPKKIIVTTPIAD